MKKKMIIRVSVALLGAALINIQKSYGFIPSVL